MRKKTESWLVWKDIHNNCDYVEEDFYGILSGVYKNTILYIKKLNNPADMFSMATLVKDQEAIKELYNTVKLSDYQIRMIKKLKEKNSELLLTLNPFILEEKYSFLLPLIDEVVLDIHIQDRLTSLDDFELELLKKIVDYSICCGINPSKILYIIINNMGCCSIPVQNDIDRMERFKYFMQIIKSYSSSNELDNKIISNIAFALKNDIIPDCVESLINYDEEIKRIIETSVETSDSTDELKDVLLEYLYGLDISWCNDIIKKYDMAEIPSEMLLEPGFVELLSLKLIIEEKNLDKLKEVANFIIKEKLSLFNNVIMEENILKIYARAFNKCKPNFTEENLLFTKDGIKFYDSGYNFYSIVKTLGAFSTEGNETTNYYEEWNNDRYRSHVNAVGLIRNDNLAFAEQDGQLHIKLGFLGFEESKLLGGAPRDINSVIDSRNMWVKLHNTNLFFPSQFINHTRRWHNELDYERKEKVSSEIFKKNPDFIILDQECENLDELSPGERKKFEQMMESSIQSAKQFGNLPILVINREKIAKNEREQIKQMIDSYKDAKDIEVLKNIVIRLNNNRNGCRGQQHKYIREKYFSNDHYKTIFEEINRIVLDEHREFIQDFIDRENKEMAMCSYDDSARDLPSLTEIYEFKRGGLSV